MSMPLDSQQLPPAASIPTPCLLPPPSPSPLYLPAGAGLCAKSALYELFNFTLQNVRASMLKTSRDLQVG